MGQDRRQGRADGWVARHPLLTFGVLAYALSWAYWLTLLARGWRVEPGSPATHLPGLAGPALAAGLVTAWVEGWPGLRAMAGRAVRWPQPRLRSLALALSPLVAGALVFAGAAVVGGRLPDLAGLLAYPGLPPGWPAPAVIGAALLLNGYGEELGWRGFLLRRLAATQRPLRAAVIVAVVWAGWHAPLFWLHAGMAAMWGPLMLGWAGGLLAGSLLLGWIFLATDSVLVVALWHTAFNFMVATPPGKGVVAAVLNGLVIVAAVRVMRAWQAAERH